MFDAPTIAEMATIITEKTKSTGPGFYFSTI
jgi:hypothetical protein